MQLDTHLPSSTRLSTIVLRWMPTFLGFPAGGFAAETLVGPIDDVSAALIGGALTGAILGLVQWLGMRRVARSPEAWLVATAVGFAVGLAAGASAVDFQTTTGALAVQGAICGGVIGIAQAIVLQRRLGRVAIAWPALLAGLWALGWTITASAGVDVEAQYTVFGSTGAIAVTAVTAILPIVLTRRAAASSR
jgi:hypothetical protein